MGRQREKLEEEGREMKGNTRYREEGFTFAHFILSEAFQLWQYWASVRVRGSLRGVIQVYLLVTGSFCLESFGRSSLCQQCCEISGPSPSASH